MGSISWCDGAVGDGMGIRIMRPRWVVEKKRKMARDADHPHVLPSLRG